MNCIKKLMLASVLTLFLIVVTASATFAWFKASENTISTRITGMLVSEYFHCGSGRKDDPFVITRPIHYYHAVEFFQRQTNLPTVYFVDEEENHDVVHFGEEYLYFQIGCPEIQLYNPSLRPETDESTEYYVFSYDNTGSIITSEHIKGDKSKNLNMAYYSGANALMPLGTSEIPFNGKVSGKGLVLENLNITTVNTVRLADGTYVERRTSDLGVFGYIGSGIDSDGNGIVEGEGEVNVIEEIYFSNLVLDLTGISTEPSAMTSIVSGATHSSGSHSIEGTDVAYVGYIAGHISGSASCNRVYVNECSIKGGAAANSGFGYFGCVDDPVTGAPLSHIESVVAELSGQGDDAGYGGSLDMMDIYDRVNSIRTTARNNGNYRYLSEVTKSIDETIDAVSYSDYVYDGTLAGNYVGYRSDSAGNYIYYNRTGADQFAYMSSTSETQLTSVKVYTYRADPDNKNEYWFESAILLAHGTNYLGVTGGTALGSVSEESALPFVWDGNYLYTRVDGIKYYLNRTTNTGAALGLTAQTEWAVNGSLELYTTSGGTAYYLYFSLEWTVSPLRMSYRLSDGNGNYLTASNTAVLNTTVSDSSVKWELSNPGGNTTFSYTSGPNTYYLCLVNGNLSVSAESNTTRNWVRDGAGYYTLVSGDRFYLVYDGEWKAVLESGYKLHDGNGNYLGASVSSIENTLEANAPLWLFSSAVGDTYVYTYINGTRHYLICEAGYRLGVTTLTQPVWHRSGNGMYFNLAEGEFYLAYEGGWTVIPRSYHIIHDGNGNYLRITGTGTTAFANTTNESLASRFFFSSTSGINPGGKIYSAYNGTKVYLRNYNGTLQLTTGENNGTEWTNDGSSIRVSSGTAAYALRFSGGSWNLLRVSLGHVITDGNGNYILVAGTGASSYTNTTDISSATVFSFSVSGANPSGYISCVYGNTTVYLRNNNGTLQLTTSTYYRTSFSNDGDNISASNQKLVFKNGEWQLSSSSVSGIKYRISYTAGGITYYMSESNGTLSYTTYSGDALLFDAKEGRISTVISGNTYYLHTTTASSPVLSLSASSVNWINNGNRLYVSSTSGWTTYYYSVTFNSGFAARRDRNTTSGIVLTFEEIYPSVIEYHYSYAEYYESYPETFASNRTSDIFELQSLPVYASPCALDISGVDEYFPLSYTDSVLQVIEKTFESIKTGTYFPLRTNSEDEGYSGTDLLGASMKNTGYIISGRYDTTTPSAVNYPSDIRISRYSTSDIRNSYSSGTSFTNLYSVNSSGVYELDLVDLADNELYVSSSTQFLTTLDEGNGNVYGLHFMDADISMDHIIQAEQVTILGRTYYNYEFPEDCIDFRTVSQGSIVFYAGTYFANNNAFFSLSQIYRNSDMSISAIKEIKKIYASALNGFAHYIYLYGDGTYTNANGTYTGALTLPSGYYEIFDTDWITNPHGVTQDYRVYYFEVPCNAGEYALGSVDGKIGAYLMYLDIGIRGGGIIEGLVGRVGEGITNLFNVDYRSPGDNKENYAIIQIGVNVPESSNNNFEVKVGFDGSRTGDGEHEKGIYTITIVNNTESGVNLYVFLCDDDDDPYNMFPYAYEIYYTNADHEKELYYSSVTNIEYWKITTGFSIPPSGIASRIKV